MHIAPEWKGLASQPTAQEARVVAGTRSGAQGRTSTVPRRYLPVPSHGDEAIAIQEAARYAFGFAGLQTRDLRRICVRDGNPRPEFSGDSAPTHVPSLPPSAGRAAEPHARSNHRFAQISRIALRRPVCGGLRAGLVPARWLTRGLLLGMRP